MTVLDKPKTTSPDAERIAWNAPLHIGTVTLVVRDLARMSAFYQQVIGLSVISEAPGSVKLGAGGLAFLELIENKEVRQRSRREAGLFHTAFLLPSRGDLARWLGHVAANRIPLQGASDHIVSEAIYLGDPEGNGIEVYADRPHKGWQVVDGQIQMTTEALDIEDLMKTAGDTPWTGAPAGSFVGHIHLQVGNIPEAEKFYSQLLGFDMTYRMPSASFLSTGGYHHHIAANIWNSRGAPAVTDAATGLKGFELIARDDAAFAEAEKRFGTALTDPWGTAITLKKA